LKKYKFNIKYNQFLSPKRYFKFIHKHKSSFNKNKRSGGENREKVSF